MLLQRLMAWFASTPPRLCIECCEIERRGRPMERVQRGGLYFERHIECPHQPASDPIVAGRRAALWTIKAESP
jgi:hypothetical protein